MSKRPLRSIAVYEMTFQQNESWDRVSYLVEAITRELSASSFVTTKIEFTSELEASGDKLNKLTIKTSMPKDGLEHVIRSVCHELADTIHVV